MAQKNLYILVSDEEKSFVSELAKQSPEGKLSAYIWRLITEDASKRGIQAPQRLDGRIKTGKLIGKKRKTS